MALGASIAILGALLLIVFVACFVGDLRVRTGHLETEVRALEAEADQATPKPSCRVDGQTVVCHLPEGR